MPTRLHVRLQKLARMLAFLGLIGVVVLSLLPGKWVPRPPYLLKPFDHAVAYFTVATPLAFAYRRVWVRTLTVIALACFAAIFEVIQLSISSRTASFEDFAFSTIGALLGTAFGTLLSTVLTRVGETAFRRTASSTSVSHK